MTEEKLSGHVILLMAPTGSGKGTLMSAAKKEIPEIRSLVSCTTRVPRPGEEEGVAYYFLSREQFEEKIKEGAFVEWASFGGNLYGTLKSELMVALQEGRIVLADIEVQGIESLMKLIPKENRTIVYIDAGDWETLRARALLRAPLTEEELALRHERFVIEKASQGLADVVLKNEEGKIEEAEKAFVQLVGNIVESKRYETT